MQATQIVHRPQQNRSLQSSSRKTINVFLKSNHNLITSIKNQLRRLPGNTFARGVVLVGGWGSTVLTSFQPRRLRSVFSHAAWRAYLAGDDGEAAVAVLSLIWGSVRCSAGCWCGVGPAIANVRRTCLAPYLWLCPWVHGGAYTVFTGRYVPAF